MATAKYNFDKNLIKASYKKDLYGAKREWFILCEDTREEQDGLCICQHKVKHITYMYNPKTKLTIIVGSKCAKKFELNNFLLPNEVLRKILNKNLIKGDYEKIKNIITYSNNIEDQFIKYFEKIINKYNNNENKLVETQKEIKDLIETYSLKYLNNIYETINNKIIDIQQNKQFIKYDEIKSYFENDIINNSINTLNEIKNKILLLYNNNNFLSNKQIKFINKVKYKIDIIINKKHFHNELIKKLLNYIVKVYIVEEHYSYYKSSYNLKNNEFRFMSLDDCNEYIEKIGPVGKKDHKTLYSKNNKELEYKEETITKIEIYNNYNIIKTYNNIKLIEQTENTKNKIEIYKIKKEYVFTCRLCNTTDICNYDIHKNNAYKVYENNNMCLICDYCSICKDKLISEKNNKHKCSLDICKCENPDYELIKANNNYYCNNCNKWKCRCQSL